MKQKTDAYIDAETLRERERHLLLLAFKMLTQVCMDSRSKFNPGTVAGAIESVVRMKCVGLCILKIFEDNRRFENRRPVHNQDRRLAQRRYGKKPVGLVRKIDVSSLERDTFLSERDRRALHIWAGRIVRRAQQLSSEI